MDLKHIARSAVMRRLEQQNPLSRTTTAVPTDLFSDGARLLRFLSGLLAEVAEELVVAAVEASAPMAETAVPTEEIIPVNEVVAPAENTAVPQTKPAVFAEETASPAEETTSPVAETPASPPTDGERNASQQAARMDGDIQAEGNMYIVVQK